MKRIQRAKDKEEIITLLMDERLGVFKEIWRLLLFAAFVGIKNGKRESLKSADPGKGIDQSTFGNSPTWPGLLYLIALVETKSPDSLSGNSVADDERVQLFQEYANGGLTILQDFFAENNADLDSLLAFIDSQKGESAREPDLDLMI